MISKPPIMEPLRNRPKRTGSTLIARANESVSQHDASLVSLSGVLGERASNVEMVKTKKWDATKKVSVGEV